MAELPDGVTTAEKLIERLSALSWTVAMAESCTAGLAADLLARQSGASRVLWGSFVCYTPAAKTVMLGLEPGLIAKYGAVSRETVCAMAEGALEKSGADAALAVTGLAGPLGDGSGAPVGEVWISAVLRNNPVEAVCFHYSGSRNEIRSQAAADALGELLKRLPRTCLRRGARLFGVAE